MHSPQGSYLHRFTCLLYFYFTFIPAAVGRTPVLVPRLPPPVCYCVRLYCSPRLPFPPFSAACHLPPPPLPSITYLPPPPLYHYHYTCSAWLPACYYTPTHRLPRLLFPTITTTTTVTLLLLLRYTLLPTVFCLPIVI